MSENNPIISVLKIPARFYTEIETQMNDKKYYSVETHFWKSILDLYYVFLKTLMICISLFIAVDRFSVSAYLTKKILK